MSSSDRQDQAGTSAAFCVVDGTFRPRSSSSSSTSRNESEYRRYARPAQRISSGIGLSPLEDRRPDCLFHDLFRLPAAVGQSCNTTYSRGTREFIRILQLHQNWALGRVSAASQEAIDAHCTELEAIRHILLRAEEPGRRHAPLESGLMPGITDLTITGADLDQYDRLLTGGVR